MVASKRAMRLAVAASICSLTAGLAHTQTEHNRHGQESPARGSPVHDSPMRESADQEFAPRAGGIWKAAVPTAPMRGEFDNFDPVGIAAGARIKADCSINWINPDDGARYCFSSGTSLEFFLYSPQTSIERARAGWRKLAAQPQ